ncbi:hypothetical protein MBLNU13_g06409t1 [Cladosporium sp. NU13]
MSLSRRATNVLSHGNSSLLWEVTADQWHAESNASGFVSLGMAENTLSQNDLIERIARVPPFSPWTLTYGDGTTGSHHLRTVLAAFFDRYFDAWQIVQAEHIMVTNGCSAALEHLFWALGDEQDCFLVSRPFFRAFIPTAELRIRCNLVEVGCGALDPFEPGIVKEYERTILKASEAGRNVRGILICNPHNPLGRCYPVETLIGLMELCHRYDLHLISDEVYALSTWKNTFDDGTATTPFTSCLSIDTSGILSQRQIHVVWGASKDFGSNGIRLGALVSQASPEMHKSLVPGALYSMVSSLADHVYADILADFTWVDAYLAKNSVALRENYNLVVDWARANKIQYAHGSNAGFFLWVQLGQVYSDNHPELDLPDVEGHVMQMLLESKVFVAPGKSFGAEEIGWFRIVFSIDRVNLFEGLERIVAVLRV